MEGRLVFACAWVGFAMLPRVTGDAAGPFVVTWGLASLGGGFALLGVVPSAALFGANALQHVQKLFDDEDPPPVRDDPKLHAAYDGFDVHAGTTIDADDRDALERFIRAFHPERSRRGMRAAEGACADRSPPAASPKGLETG